MSAFQQGMAPIRAMEDDSDVEEEALVADYQEQVQYGQDDDLDGLDQAALAQAADDLQARLLQAAQPLDYQATLEAKFSSYDNYCSLFHYILNSEGPVDLEPPSVSLHYTSAEMGCGLHVEGQQADVDTEGSTTGPGM